jgi:methionyl-tRNA synthetase
MSAPKRYTITAALPYTNGPIHIGHLAGVYVPADIYARYLRLIGKDVAYISGSDEHGAAIPMRAKKEGVSPQVIIDKYHKIIKQSFVDFGISLTTPEPLLKFTMKLHRHFLQKCIMTENLSKKFLHNYMMQKQISF